MITKQIRASGGKAGRDRRAFPGRAAVSILALAAFCAIPAAGVRAETVAIDRISHIHGVAVDPDQPSRLYLATHEGLFRAGPDGTATRVGELTADLMSFAAEAGDSPAFFASGHPPGGGNLGLLVSSDRGTSWRQISPGAGGPVDFHAMTVSRADPAVIYGSYQGLQRSVDGGRSWSMVGSLPERTFEIAASARDPDTVYAAAIGGLFVSRDGGRSWSPVFMQQHPTTLVAVSASGLVYAFVYGIGLLAHEEGTGKGWAIRSTGFADRYPVKIAIDPRDPDRIHVVADTGAIVTSKDGGRSWVSYMGHDRETPDLIAGAGRTYQEYCQSCHGEKGVGERPKDMNAQDEYGFVAPPLDNSAHGWHHSDEDLARTILNGSPRNPRMLPFKEILSEAEAKDAVAYIKSLWSFRSLACQGSQHMKCMH